MWGKVIAVVVGLLVCVTEAQGQVCTTGQCTTGQCTPQPRSTVLVQSRSKRADLQVPDAARRRFFTGLPALTMRPTTPPAATPPLPPVSTTARCVGPCARLKAIEQALTAISTQLDNAGAVQTQVASAVSEMAVAQANTLTKLDAAITLLQELNSRPINVTLTVQSPANLPASYVDTSTIWAIQRKTGISHAVLVINSADPDWARLKPEYIKAQHKFPAMQLVDVQSIELQISPTPQLVLYYIEEGREPAVVSGDRAVGATLREFYVD